MPTPPPVLLHTLDTIYLNKFLQLVINKCLFDRQNVQLGVKSGMVRTVVDCQAGVDALKEKYRQLSLANKAEGVLKEWFAKSYLEAKYLVNLSKGVDDKWAKDHSGKNVNVSLKEALKEGVGQPLLDLINYLENEHKSHCLPNDLASGLSNLPVNYVYNKLVPDKDKPTTKKLPTGEPLNGAESYKLIVSYFTTTDISPEEIYAEGKRQLKYFYDQVIGLKKLLTASTKQVEGIKSTSLIAAVVLCTHCISMIPDQWTFLPCSTFLIFY